jgi:hypothetical protein
MFYFAVSSYRYHMAEYDLVFRAGKTIPDHSGGNWEMARFLQFGHIFWFEKCLFSEKESVDRSRQRNRVV